MLLKILTEQGKADNFGSTVHRRNGTHHVSIHFARPHLLSGPLPHSPSTLDG